MTEQEIFEHYEIELVTIDVTFADGSKLKRKTFLSNTVLESYFDMSFNDPTYLNTEVIPLVQHFIDGNSPPVDPDLGGIDDNAVAYIDEIHFYNPYSGSITFRIPLEHFRVIAEAWRDFLLG